MARLTNTFRWVDGSRGNEPQLSELQYGQTQQRGRTPGEQTQ